METAKLWAFQVGGEVYLSENMDCKQHTTGNKGKILTGYLVGLNFMCCH